MSIKHPKVVAGRAACAIGAHEALLNLLTYLLLNFLEITHVKIIIYSGAVNPNTPHSPLYVACLTR